MIIIDSREHHEERDYFTRHNIPFKLQALSCGDYAVEDPDGCRVVVERKEIKDFISSLFSGRLDDQLGRLRLESYPILVISGSLQEYYDSVTDSKFTEEQFYGAISSAIVRYGLRCVVWNQCENAHEDTLGIISKILVHTDLNHLDKIPKRQKHAFNNKIGFVRELTGCPQATAIELLKHYTNVKNIIDASPEDLKTFKGLGPKRIERMEKLLNG